jgi:DNA-binding NtrC family response regulator
VVAFIFPMIALVSDPRGIYYCLPSWGPHMPALVLIVHNDAETRQLAVTALSAAGHETIGFEDPMKALDEIEAASDIRLLVTRVDFGEGRVNGIALARMFKARVPGSKVAFVAFPDNQIHTEGLGDFLPMPLDPQALVDVVNRLLLSTD